MICHGTVEVRMKAILHERFFVFIKIRDVGKEVFGPKHERHAKTRADTGIFSRVVVGLSLNPQSSFTIVSSS